MQRYAARRAGLSVTADPCILRDQLQEFSRGYTRILFTVFFGAKKFNEFLCNSIVPDPIPGDATVSFCMVVRLVGE